MTNTTGQLGAMLDGAAFAAIENVGWIRVRGDDRVRWLNGMVTNSITALKPGDGCYCFFLSAQGRIQGDCTAWMQGDEILLETAADRVDALTAYLERFIIMDDVELERVEHRVGLLVFGAAEKLQELGLGAPEGLATADWHGEPMTAVQGFGVLAPRFEFWSDAGAVGLLAESLRASGLPEVGAEALEQLRLLEGVPLYGVDIREKELPQETNQLRALHFSKGCYLGQEIVERIHSRGQVNRLLQALTLTGTVPAAGTALMASEKAVGEMTSAAEVPGFGVLGLGYVRREALDSGAALTYEGGTAAVRVVHVGESLHP